MHMETFDEIPRKQTFSIQDVVNVVQSRAGRWGFQRQIDMHRTERWWSFPAFPAMRVALLFPSIPRMPSNADGYSRHQAATSKDGIAYPLRLKASCNSLHVPFHAFYKPLVIQMLKSLATHPSHSREKKTNLRLQKPDDVGKKPSRESCREAP